MNTHHIEYIITGQKKKEWHFYCSGPIIALNGFHRFMQRQKECNADRKVIRQKLKPNDYRIIRLFLRYPGGEGRGQLESDFDLPNSANPDLALRKKKPAEPAFDFYSDPQYAHIKIKKERTMKEGLK
jgi:hypothetical protein